MSDTHAHKLATAARTLHAYGMPSFAYVWCSVQEYEDGDGEYQLSTPQVPKTNAGRSNYAISVRSCSCSNLALVHRCCRSFLVSLRQASASLLIACVFCAVCAVRLVPCAPAFCSLASILTSPQADTCSAPKARNNNFGSNKSNHLEYGQLKGPHNDPTVDTGRCAVQAALRPLLLLHLLLLLLLQMSHLPLLLLLKLHLLLLLHLLLHLLHIHLFAAANVL